MGESAGSDERSNFEESPSISESLNSLRAVPSLAAVIRALDTISFSLCLLGWLLLGVFGTWKEAAPFWIGAPLLWAAALCGLFTLHWGLRGKLSRACLASVLVFTGYIMWRALNSDVAWLARQDVVFGATAFIGWVLTAVRYEKRRHRFALIVVWSLLIAANLGMGLYQKYVNQEANPLSFLGFRHDSEDAVFGGFFPNSNHLCGFLELTAFIVLAIAVFGRVHSFVKMLCGLVFCRGGCLRGLLHQPGRNARVWSGSRTFWSDRRHDASPAEAIR